MNSTRSSAPKISRRRDAVSSVIESPTRTDAASAWRAKTCCAVIVRSGRERPKKLIIQWKSAPTRFLNPVRKVRWTTSQISQPANPHTRASPALADGVVARDGGEAAEVAVAERPRLASPSSRRRISPRRAVPTGSRPRRAPAARRAPSGRRPRRPRDDRAACSRGSTGIWPVRGRLDARLCGEHRAERRRLHAGRPDLRQRVEPLAAVGRQELDAAGVHAGDECPAS